MTTRAIDPVFVEVCEPGSILVSAIVPDLPIPCGAKVQAGQLTVSLADSPMGLPTEATVTVRGIRKGFAGVRFPTKTKAEMEHNHAFWSRAHR